METKVPKLCGALGSFFHQGSEGTVDGRNPVNQLRLAASIISHFLYWLVLGDEQGAKDTDFPYQLKSQ